MLVGLMSYNTETTGLATLQEMKISLGVSKSWGNRLHTGEIGIGRASQSSDGSMSCLNTPMDDKPPNLYEIQEHRQ